MQSKGRSNISCNWRMVVAKWLDSVLGPFSQKPWKLFRPFKSIFYSSISQNREVYTAETSCMKTTSVHIKNTCM